MTELKEYLKKAPVPPTWHVEQRTLFILQGISGIGKSTIIGALRLGKFTVEPDRLRDLINPNELTYRAECEEPRPTRDISVLTSKTAFTIAVDIVRRRMELGQMIIFDSTAVRRKTIGGILKLAHEFLYQVIYVRFPSSEADIERAVEHNSHRIYDRVPDDVIRNQAERLAKYEYQPNETVITPEEFKSYFTVDKAGKPCIRPDAKAFPLPTRHSTHSQDPWTLIIGDIQGCWRALEKALLDNGAYYPENTPHNGATIQISDNVHIICAGDLFDRGDDNTNVFLFAYTHASLPQLTLVEGNHDSYLRRWGKQGEYLSASTQATVNEIKQRLNLSDKELSKYATRLYKTLLPAYSFRKGEDGLGVVTHAGIHPELTRGFDPSAMGRRILSAQDYYYGLGKPQPRGGDYDTDVDYIISNVPLLWITQYHGHRNARHLNAYPYKRVYNLENGVEHGGTLRCALITPTAKTIVEEQTDEE